MKSWLQFAIAFAVVYLLWRLWTRHKVTQQANQTADATSISIHDVVTSDPSILPALPPGKDRTWTKADPQLYPDWYQSNDGVWVNPVTGAEIVNGSPPAQSPSYENGGLQRPDFTNYLATQAPDTATPQDQIIF